MCSCFINRCRLCTQKWIYVDSWAENIQDAYYCSELLKMKACFGMTSGWEAAFEILIIWSCILNCQLSGKFEEEDCNFFGEFESFLKTILNF